MASPPTHRMLALAAMLAIGLAAPQALAAPDLPLLPPAPPAPPPLPPVPPMPGLSPPPTADVPRNDNSPQVIRVGTTAVMTIRETTGTVSVKERAAVIQSRITQVLLHHPYLKSTDVKLLRNGTIPIIYWGQFPIVSVDAAHARANNFSSPDILAHAWANNLRTAIRDFMAAKKMPERALFRNELNSDFTYGRTDHTLSQPTLLKNTRYIFNPEDFEWGAGMKDRGQYGYVVFIKKDAENPPTTIYLGNAEGTFTEYNWIRPEDTP